MILRIQCKELGCSKTFLGRKGCGLQRQYCAKHRSLAYRFWKRYNTDDEFRNKQLLRIRKRRQNPKIRNAERQKDLERKRKLRLIPQERQKHNRRCRLYRRTLRGRQAFNSWRYANPALVQAARHRRRNSEAVGRGFTSEQWEALKTKYGNKCLGCGRTERELKRLKRHLVPDHVVPIAHPSKKLWGKRGSISNIQPL